MTRLLERASAGDADAFDRLMPLVYEELHDQAARLLRRERPNETLRPYTTLEEIDTFVMAMEDILANGIPSGTTSAA